MAIHQLSLGTKTNRWDNYSIIFIIPRSARVDDFAIISPWSERQLFKKGFPDSLEIYGYKPVLEKIEQRIKEFLKNKVLERHSKNYNLRRFMRWGSAAGIVACFFFVFSGFFDDILFDPFFATVFGYTIFREYEEKKSLNQWNKRIDTLKVKESAILSALFHNFTQLDSDDYVAIDWEKTVRKEPLDIILSLRTALSTFLGFRHFSDEEKDSGTMGFFSISIARSFRLFVVRQFALTRSERARKELKIGPGYFEIYKGFLEYLQCEGRSQKNVVIE